MVQVHRRQLTIGEYAAATQLTAKALRLYDEQGLIKPRVVDSATGYRYYETDQVATGRLVRALRDMNLSLTQVAQVLASSRGSQPALLRQFLRDAELRLARERAAYRSALLMLHPKAATAELEVREFSTDQQLVAVFTFNTHRRNFAEQALLQLSAHSATLRSHRSGTDDQCAIALLEPLSDDDTQVELAIPVDPGANLINHTSRLVSPRGYAAVSAPLASCIDGFTPAIDALFDWFDRKGMHAIGHPEFVLRTGGDDLGGSIRWAFAVDENS